MKLFLALVCLSLSVPEATATLIVLEITPTQVIVAADSHRVIGEGESARADDHSCKVVQLDPNTFFFATGDIAKRGERTGIVIFDALSFSRTAFAASREPRDRYSLARIVAQWAEMMREGFMRGYALTPWTFPTTRADIAQGVFCGTNGNLLQAYHAGFAFMPTSTLPEILVVNSRIYPNDQFPINRYGVTRAFPLIDEFLANTTPRSRDLNFKFSERFKDSSDPDYEARRLQGAVQAAIAWIPEKNLIGGRVDVLVLHRGGSIRWVERKPECEGQP